MNRIALILLILLCAAASAGNFPGVPNVGVEISNADAGLNAPSSGITGTMLIRRFPTLRGSITADHNSINNLELAGVTSTVTGTPSGGPTGGSGVAQIMLDNNLITNAFQPYLIIGAISMKFNPITSGGFPSMTAIPCKHLYISHSSGPLTSVAGWFPKVTRLYGALVLSADNLVTVDDSALPVLNTIGDQLEVDAMSTLTSITLSALTDILDVSQSCANVDVPAILAANNPNLVSINTPLLGNLSGAIYCQNTAVATLGISAVTNFGANFQIDCNHAKLSTATVTALLAQIDTTVTANHAGGTNYTDPGGAGCVSGNACALINFSVQSPSAPCSGACATSKAHLISIMCPTSGNCVKTD